MDSKKPKHFIVFKIIGFIGIVATIVGFILSFSGFGNFENNNFMIGAFLAPFGMFIGIGGLVIGFSPEISKMSAKSTKHIINENKDDLIDITKTSADIVEDAITQTAKAAYKGLTEKDSKFCKYCGHQIEKDSIFCNKCGKEQ